MKVVSKTDLANVTYEVGFAKPPVTTRFKPGTSGNPNGRPKGSKNTVPSLAEERIKKLILEEAYRTIPILEKGRRVSIPMITAVLRAVAMNAAKGNNRAAILFTALVSKTESENKKLASETFKSALDYKDIWTKELKRRERLGINLPDPVPHPDDIVINARKMEVKIAGPMTKDDFPRYQLGADFLLAYEEINAANIKELDTLPDGPEKVKLLKRIGEVTKLCDSLRPHYGSRSERTKDPLIREIEQIVGVPFELDHDDKSENPK